MGGIAANYDKMFSQAFKGLLCKALVHAVRLLYHTPPSFAKDYNKFYTDFTQIKMITKETLSAYFSADR